MITKKMVSIIIPTYNSQSTLRKCLESIKRQSYKNIEIIIVDKMSTDKTVSIANMFETIVFRINARERCEQINFGIAKSNGEYIYRVDSDFILDDTVVEEAVNTCEFEKYDAILIHNTSDPTISFWSKVRKLERDCYRNDTLNVAARFFKRTVFEEIGGFDECLVASEDYDFHNRLLEANYKIGNISSQEVHIGEPKCLYDIIQKHYYYGKTIKEFIKKNQRRGIRQLSPIRSSFLRNWLEFVKHPILAIGFIIYQFARYIPATVGYISKEIEDHLYVQNKNEDF